MSDLCSLTDTRTSRLRTGVVILWTLVMSTQYVFRKLVCSDENLITSLSVKDLFGKFLVVHNLLFLHALHFCAKFWAGPQFLLS